MGARGTNIPPSQSKAHLWIDLLLPSEEDRLARNPEDVLAQIRAMEGPLDWVVIDEIQKVPRLLDVVHYAIESMGLKFALTGSSARKLKRGNANMLAGRALVHHMFPLTHSELGKHFDLQKALTWGTLPSLLTLTTDQEKSEYLKSYALTYLNEEIWSEHMVRKLDPFRRFLEVAAQCNGEPINFSNVARDVGADQKTVRAYFQILEETLVGTLLEPYATSVRKRQSQRPKFYFFDTGVQRALSRSLSIPLSPNTCAYGRAFEHFLIVEIHRLIEYARKDYRLSYLRTKDQVEIDLIIERPGEPTALVEIKSTDQVQERHIAQLAKTLPAFPNAEAYCFSLDTNEKRYGKVHCLPWQRGLQTLGLT